MQLIQVPEHVGLLRELTLVRRAGPLRLRELELPSLLMVAARLSGTDATGGTGRTDATARPTPRGRVSVELLLQQAVARLDDSTLREAAAYTLGLAHGTRAWPPAARRRHAAGLYGLSTERFRKHQERLLLGQVAEQVLRIADLDGPAPAPGQAAPSAGHRTVRLPRFGPEAVVSLHVHPVDLLRDVDVVVSPTNTHLALPEAYKSSVSASLRRAGAVRDLTGGLVEDSVHDELVRWRTRHGSPGRPVATATVAPTGAGALAEQGVRRIYHAAVAVPRAGTNEYDVQAADVTRAVTRVFALLALERNRFDPPLRSVCLPLLGSGRGGLEHELSARAVWEAVEAELVRNPRWQIHLVVRRQPPADLVERLLRARGGEHCGRTPVG